MAYNSRGRRGSYNSRSGARGVRSYSRRSGRYSGRSGRSYGRSGRGVRDVRIVLEQVAQPAVTASDVLNSGRMQTSMPANKSMF